MKNAFMGDPVDGHDGFDCLIIQRHQVIEKLDDFLRREQAMSEGGLGIVGYSVVVIAFEITILRRNEVRKIMSARLQ